MWQRIESDEELAAGSPPAAPGPAADPASRRRLLRAFTGGAIGLLALGLLAGCGGEGGDDEEEEEEDD